MKTIPAILFAALLSAATQAETTTALRLKSADMHPIELCNEPESSYESALAQFIKLATACGHPMTRAEVGDLAIQKVKEIRAGLNVKTTTISVITDGIGMLAQCVTFQKKGARSDPTALMNQYVKKTILYGKAEPGRHIKYRQAIAAYMVSQDTRTNTGEQPAR